MPKGFKPNKRGIAQAVREIEKEFARHPVRVPVHASLDEAHLEVGGDVVHNGLGFEQVPERTALRRATMEATLVLLLELEERGPDERGLDPRHQFLTQHLHHLTEPIRTWASENNVELTRELLNHGYLRRETGSLAGQLSADLSEKGRLHAARLRLLQSGRARQMAVCERVLGLVGAAEAEGRSRVDPADLRGTAQAWLAGVQITDEEANRAGSDLQRRGLIEANEVDQGVVSHARLTADGARVVDVFGGSITAWEKSKTQGGMRVGDQININDSTGVQVATRTSGEVKQSATTQTSLAPDLADLCTQIRETVPNLDLDEEEQQELIEEVERLEGAADEPEARLERVGRWLRKINDLLSSDTTGNAVQLLTKVAAAIRWVGEKLS